VGKKLDDLIIGLQLQAKAFEDGLKDVKKQLNKHSNEVRNASKSYDKLAIAAGVAFWKITDAIKSGIDTFNEYRAASVGLQSIVEGTGNSFSKAQQFIEAYTKDGLVPAADAATALKNLLNRGYTQTQAEDVMRRLKDSASFGRQAALSLGEAVKSATEGLKNENSILVDNAGVTKNVSVMWKEYAEVLGKSVNDLTTAEKIQAEYNGIMKETQNQLGDAAKLSEEFAGAQSRSAKAVKDMTAAFGEALVPVLRPALEAFTRIIVGITDFIKAQPELSAAVITAATAFLSLVTAFAAVVSAIAVLRPALAALNTSFLGLLANPYVLALTAVAAAAAYVAVSVSKAKKAQEEFNAAVEKYNKIRKEGISQADVPQIKEEAENLKKLIDQYDKLSAKYNELKQSIDDGAPQLTVLATAEEETGISAEKLTEEFAKLGIEIDVVNGNVDEARKLFKDLTRAIDEASIKTGAQLNDQAREVAQRNANIQATKNLIEVYKSAEKGSSDWLEAEKKLAEQFPQFATAAGIKIEAIESVTSAQEDAVKAEWKVLMAEVQMTKIKVQSLLTEKAALLAVAEAERSALMGPGDVRHYSRTGMPEAIRQKVEETNAAVKANKSAVDELRNSLTILDELLSSGMSDIPGIMPVNFAGIGKAYENAALESALKIHNHRMAMDELTKEQEIASLEEILRKYAKTADERMDLEEEIYRAKKELRERDLADIEKAIEDEAKKLADRTDLSERWIQRQKSLGNLTAQDEIDAYNRVIKYHQEYLDQIKADTKISVDEKKRIIEEETRYIQDQQDKILTIQRTYAEKAVNEYIEAKRKQYETERSLEDDRLNEKLKALDKEYAEKERQLDAESRKTDLESLYEQEKRYANAATREGQEKLADIRKRIADLQADELKEQWRAEKESRKEAIEQEIKDNQEKYKKLNEALETEKEQMLAAAVEYAKEANKVLTDGQNEIAASLSNVIKQFDTESASLIKQGMDKLRQLVQGYKSIMEEISLVPNINLAGAGSGTGAAKGVGSISVTVNDYGDKNINSKDEAVDYTKELFDTAEATARAWGGKI
jgi:hypothetical protein